MLQIEKYFLYSTEDVVGRVGIILIVDHMLRFSERTLSLAAVLVRPRIFETIKVVPQIYH